MDEIIKEILAFRNDRDWNKFHKMKDLLLGINIEVGELQELMLWQEENEIKEKISDPTFKSEVSNELADIFIFLVYISNKVDVDLKKAIKEKLEIHKNHYPIEKSKGKRRKYDKLNDEDNQ